MANRLETISEHIEAPGMWPIGIEDYRDLFATLDRMYVTVDTADIARRHFKALQQRGEFSVYSNFITEFQRLAWEARRSPAQMVEALKVKVSPAIYRHLMTTARLDRPRPDDVEGWITLFQHIVTDMEDLKFKAKAYEHRGPQAGGGSSGGGRGGNNNQGSKPSTPVSATGPPLGEMELDRKSVV